MGYAPAMFHEIGELSLPSREVLDVGAQDVGLGSAGDLETLNAFIRRFNPQGRPLEAARYPAIIEAREVYARAGFAYTCIDVDERPGTLRVDLARFEIPRPRGRYGLVVNVGTTEHLASPAATFALMHEMCCDGGFLYNDVPLFGLGNHGLVNPTPKFWHALIWMNGYKAHRVNVRTCDESSMDRGNFYHDYLDYMKGLGAIRNVSSLITTVLEKRGEWPFIVPYDAVFGDDDRGLALAGLLAGSYHPFVKTGAYTEREAVAGINHFLELNGRPLRIASLAEAGGSAAETAAESAAEAPAATGGWFRKLAPKGRRG